MNQLELQLRSSHFQCHWNSGVPPLTRSVVRISSALLVGEHVVCNALRLSVLTPAARTATLSSLVSRLPSIASVPQKRIRCISVPWHAPRSGSQVEPHCTTVHLHGLQFRELNLLTAEKPEHEARRDRMTTCHIRGFAKFVRFGCES